MNESKVTILMPCAGDGRFFEEAYLSALQQTHKDFRLYVLDNASKTGAYRDIVTKHADPRVEYIHFDERLSLPENWQRCLSFTGDGCFCFLHDDDLWDPNYLSKASSILFSKNAPDAVLNWHVAFSDPKEMRVKPEPSELWRQFHSADPLRQSALLILGDWGHMSAILFRKRMFNFDLHSLWNLDQRYLHAYAFGGTLQCSIDAPVWIRSHPGNASNASKSIRNLRERDGFAKRQLVSQMTKPGFRDAVRAVALSDPFSAYRLAKAIFSWPIDPLLVAWSRPLMEDRMIVQQIRRYPTKGRLMAVPGTLPRILASLFIDSLFLWKARSLFRASV